MRSWRTAPPAHASGADSTRTREAILRAGIKQFSERGAAGARMEAIATEAGVNKALLHYYFRSKDGLYKAALRTVFAGMQEHALAALNGPGSAGERLLRWSLQHFDRMASKREFQRLMHQEMMRVHQGGLGDLPPLIAEFFQPLLRRILAIVEDGVASGEWQALEPLQIFYSLFGLNVAYFVTAPVMRLAASFEPFAPASLRRRREASITLLGLGLFCDRAHGCAVARSVLSAAPRPASATVRRKRDL